MADRTIRAYDRAVDLEAVTTIWREVGWIDWDDEDDAKAMATFLDAAEVELGVLDGSPECAVSWAPGTIRYQDRDLTLCAVTAVTTSLLGRKQGLATELTARALRAGATSGASVAALGMFEQGFYDRVGFGTGAYHHEVSFDPSSLLLDHIPYRQPVRLTGADGPDLHQALANRHRSHGSVVLDPPTIVEAELAWYERPFALGYRDTDGRLTHFVAGSSAGENGPFSVKMVAFAEPAQLLELLRLLKELGDQVTSVRFPEPAVIQLQDLLAAPIEQERRTRSSVHASGISSLAWWQVRILDLEPCVAARSWAGPPVRCNLVLDDPITAVLAKSDDGAGRPGEDGGGWTGVGGTYQLEVGERSSISPGSDARLPTIEASIGAFTRCWFGVRPATSLALTDRLGGPADLLADLDEALRLPIPNPGLDF